MIKMTCRQLRDLIREEVEKSQALREISQTDSWVIGELDLSDMTPESIRALVNRMDNPSFANALQGQLKIPIFRYVSAGTNGAKLAQAHGISVDGPHPCRQKNWKKKSWVSCPEGVNEEDLLSGWPWKYFAQILPEHMRDETGGRDFIVSEVEPDNEFSVGNMGIKVVNPEDYAEVFEFVDNQRNPRRSYRRN